MTLAAPEQNLRRLDAQHFDWVVSVELQVKLQPTFATLTYLDLSQSCSSFAFAILGDIRVLRLDSDPANDLGHYESRVDGHISSANAFLADLEYLQMGFQPIPFWDFPEGQVSFDIFEHIDPTKLVALDVNFDSSLVKPFIGHLPTFTTLQSLVLSISHDLRSSTPNPSGPLLVATMAGAAKLNLRHLTLSVWPSPDTLRSLPSTLTSLVVDFGHPRGRVYDNEAKLLPPLHDPDVPTMITLVRDARHWKSHYLPALQVLGVSAYALVEEDAGDMDAKARVLAAMAGVEGFEFFLLAPGEPERFFPGQWV